MASKIHIDIVSAEEEIYSGEASMVFAPGEMGELGIAPQHTPLMTRLKPGAVRVQTEGAEELSFYVSGGMLEVQPHVVTVLADTARRAADIDEAAAMQAKERAEQHCRTRHRKSISRVPRPNWPRRSRSYVRWKACVRI